jgi:hypothetical protein
MNKILLFVFILSGAISTGFAQTKPGSQLSIGAEFGLPTGQASLVYGSILGASLKFELPLPSTRINFTVTTGFSSFLVKYDYTGILQNATYVPVEIGGKYYINKVVYFEGDFGASINSNSNYTGPGVAFIYAPIIGVSAPTNNHKATIDLGLRYEGRVEPGGTVSQVAVRLAYRFGL